VLSRRSSRGLLAAPEVGGPRRELPTLDELVAEFGDVRFGAGKRGW
jgi:hypothetical protein